MQIETFEIVVIGGGPIGIFCTFVLGIFGFKKIALIESSDQLGGECIHLYPKKIIYDVAGIPEIKAEKLIENLIEQMNAFSPSVYLNSQITNIRKEGEVFILETNNSENAEIRTSRIMISGRGSLTRRKPTDVDGFEKAEADGFVQYSLTDPDMFRDKDVIIGGGGDSALDWCFALNGIARSIAIIHRREGLTAMQSSQDQLMELVGDGSVELLLEAQISRIETISFSEGEKKQMLVVLPEGERLLQFDFFIPCYGSNIDTNSLASMLKNLKVKFSEDGLISSKEYKTDEEGVYHIGKFGWITVGFGYAVEAAKVASEDKDGKKHIPYSTSNPIFKKS